MKYKIKFRCPNCGEIFEKEIQKGVVAQGKGGECPNCGVQDGAARVGGFEVIRGTEPRRTVYNG